MFFDQMEETRGFGPFCALKHWKQQHIDPDPTLKNSDR